MILYLTFEKNVDFYWKFMFFTKNLRFQIKVIWFIDEKLCLSTITMIISWLTIYWFRIYFLIVFLYFNINTNRNINRSNGFLNGIFNDLIFHEISIWRQITTRFSVRCATTFQMCSYIQISLRLTSNYK